MIIYRELNNNKQDFLISLILIFLPATFLIGSSVINISVILIDSLFLYILYKNKDFKYLNNKYFYSLLIFWFYLIINLLFSINVNESLERSLGFIRFVIFAFAINYFFSTKTKEIKNFILRSWLVIFSFISIDLIIEFSSGSNIFGFQSPFEGRLGGVLGNELKIGHFYSAFILYALYSVYEISNKKTENNIFFYIFIILFLFISLIIGERSNFLKTIFILSFFVFLIDKKNFLKKFLSLGFFVIALFILIFNNPNFHHRFLGKLLIPFITNPVELISESKYGSHYKVAVQVFKNNKLFGVGLKNYREEVKDKKYDRDASIHPHQVHFEILSELGLIGYILFISIFFFNVYHSIKFYLIEKDELKLCGILFVVATLIPLLPSGSFFTTYGAALFWFNFSFMLSKMPK